MTPAGDQGRRWLAWGGRVLGVLVAVQMVFSASMKLFLPAGVPEHFAELGWSLSHMQGLALLELVVTALYCIPRTAVIGAVLLTGYLGGATAAHLRIADAVFVYPVAVGAVAWAGLCLRRPELRRVWLGGPARAEAPR
jgi:hypothetical protein